MLLLVSISSSLLGCDARLGSAGLVHCSDWVCACKWGQGNLLRRNVARVDFSSVTGVETFKKAFIFLGCVCPKWS